MTELSDAEHKALEGRLSPEERKTMASSRDLPPSGYGLEEQLKFLEERERNYWKMSPKLDSAQDEF